jgi:hypothetical protein
MAPSAFPFSARWRLSPGCCAASREIIRLKSKVGEITMDNELLYAKIEALEGNALWPTGGRDDEPDTLALLGSRLWHGARRAGVEDLAR